MTLTAHDLLRFRVKSSDGVNEHLVDLAANNGDGECSCADYRCRQAKVRGRCKHIIECREDLTTRFIREFIKQFPSKED